MAETLPLSLRSASPRLSDALVGDCVLFILVLVSTLLLYFVVQKWGSRRVLFVSSLLASIGFLTISIIAILEYWYSLKSYPLLAWVKCAGLVLSFVCVCSGVVPVMLMRCVEVFPTMAQTFCLRCTCALCVVLLAVNYPLSRWLAMKLHSSFCSYVVALAVYVTTCVCSLVTADYSSYPVEEIDVLLGFAIWCVSSNTEHAHAMYKYHLR